MLQLLPLPLSAGFQWYALSTINYQLSTINFPASMHLLVTYDVATSSEGGERRLRRVAKTCKDFGQRVQHSVFECKVDPGQFTFLKQRLLGEMDLAHDSLRFYFLGNNWQRRVEHHGANQSYDPDGPLII